MKKLVPSQEILFAAKCGFLSKPICEEFFTKRSYSWNSRVWHSFVKDGYFKSHSSRMQRDVLILDKRGKLFCEAHGCAAVSPPHINQLDHDEKMARMAFILMNSDGIGKIEFESEAKRDSMFWKVANRNAKYPDLTIEIKGQGKFSKISLELELSRKSHGRYKKVMDSYANAKSISAVIFISDKQTIFNRLTEAMKDTEYPSWERPIGYGDLVAWQKDPLTAPIYLNREVATLKGWIDQVSIKSA